MTKLQVYRVDQMNIEPVDPFAFPAMANHRNVYLCADADELISDLYARINKLTIARSRDEPTCECKEQREAWICVKCGKPEASVPHGNPLDQMAAGAELYGDPATPGYKR